MWKTNKMEIVSAGRCGACMNIKMEIWNYQKHGGNNAMQHYPPAMQSQFRVAICLLTNDVYRENFSSK